MNKYLFNTKNINVVKKNIQFTKSMLRRTQTKGFGKPAQTHLYTKDDLFIFNITTEPFKWLWQTYLSVFFLFFFLYSFTLYRRHNIASKRCPLRAYYEALFYPSRVIVIPLRIPRINNIQFRNKNQFSSRLLKIYA